MPLDLALQLTGILIGVGIVISSAEYVAGADLYQSSSLMSWRVLGASGSRMNALIAPLCEGPGFLAVVLLRAIAGVALIVGPTGIWHPLAVGVALLTSTFLSYRNPAGNDGSDQMTVVVLAGLFIATLPLDPRARMAGYWLIAAQSALSYFVAGVSKAVSPVWRNGSAAVLIFRTATYGQFRFARLCAQHLWISRSVCWGAIAFEVGFPVALIGPAPVLATVLAIGAVFHVGNAAMMGLNVFTWAFVATYPSILVCAL